MFLVLTSVSPNALPDILDFRLSRKYAKHIRAGLDVPVGRSPEDFQKEGNSARPNMQ
jgi:hypothetical protein